MLNFRMLNLLLLSVVDLVLGLITVHVHVHFLFLLLSFHFFAILSDSSIVVAFPFFFF